MNGDADEALEAELQHLNEWHNAVVAALDESSPDYFKDLDAAAWARVRYLDEHPALRALAQRRYDEDQAKLAKFAKEFREHNIALVSGRRSPMSQPGRLPVSHLRWDRRLARDLGIPKAAAERGLRHAPPLSVPDPKWQGYVIEMFGEELAGEDAPPIDSSPRWAGWFLDRPARPIAVRAWRIIVRYRDSDAWVEARRSRLGSWSVALRGLEMEHNIDRARKVLRGVALVRSRYNLPGPGRPTKWTPAEFARVRDRETAAWRKRTGIDDRPCPPKELAYRMGMAESGHRWTLAYYYELARRMNLEG